MTSSTRHMSAWVPDEWHKATVCLPLHPSAGRSAHACTRLGPCVRLVGMECTAPAQAWPAASLGMSYSAWVRSWAVDGKRRVHLGDASLVHGSSMKLHVVHACRDPRGSRLSEAHCRCFAQPV